MRVINFMFDVVVVGGNLAGTNAAIHAAEKGCRVAVIEKNKEPFLPAHCGECVDDVTAELLLLDTGGCVRNEVDTAVVNVSSSKEYVLKLKKHRLLVFDRNCVEKTLLKKAETLGVELLLGKSMRNIKSPYEIVLDDNNIVEGKIVIDASGIACQVGRRIGLDTRLRPMDIGVCIQSRVRSRFDAYKIKTWFHSPYAPFGYAWIFPINDTMANIGLGVAGGQQLDLGHLLEKYIADMVSEEHEIISTFRACVPVASPLRRIVKGNVMVVGDAARLVNPVFGNGIYNAIFSGGLAGTIASMYIHGEIFSLEPYQDAMCFQIVRLKRIHALKTKLTTDKKFIRAYRMVFSLLWFMNRIIPNFLENRVAKDFGKNKLILSSYK